MNGYVAREICTQVGTYEKDKTGNEQQIRCPLHCCHVGCMECQKHNGNATSQIISTI